MNYECQNCGKEITEEENKENIGFCDECFDNLEF